MRTLLVSATKIEAEQIIKTLNMNKVSPFLYSSNEFDTNLLVTGIGSVATLFAMLTHRDIAMYDIFINLGIAGAYSDDIKIGNVYNINSDSFVDIGLNTDTGFKPIFNTEFNNAYNRLINNGKIYNTSEIPLTFKNLKKLKGATVVEPEKRKPQEEDVETMEGAAFMLVAKHYKKPFVQIRGISNIIGITKRKDWNISSPISKYSNLIIKHIKQQAV